MLKFCFITKFAFYVMECSKDRGTCPCEEFSKLKERLYSLSNFFLFFRFFDYFEGMFPSNSSESKATGDAKSFFLVVSFGKALLHSIYLLCSIR